MILGASAEKKVPRQPNGEARQTTSSKVDSWGDESYLKSQFNSLYNKFCSQGYPVVIGEYGAIDKSAFDSNNTACRAEFASKVCTYAKKYGCIPIWWDNGATGTYGFGLFNRNTGAVTQPKIINAITAVYPSSGNTSGSTSSIDTGKTYMLKNVNSGLYMDVCGAKAVNGTNVIQYSASKAKANNTWKFVPDGKGYYYIYSCLGDGRTFLLDVSCNSSANGDKHRNLQKYQLQCPALQACKKFRWKLQHLYKGFRL